MRNKIYWRLNWILAAVIFVILAIVFAHRYLVVGYPVEATWTEEILKYVFMWPVLSVITGVVCWVPFRALSDYLAKKQGEDEE